MAVIKADGKLIAIDDTQAQEIWLVLNNKKEATDKQVTFIGKVQAVYFSPHNAPDDYIARYPEVTLRFLDKTRGVNKNNGQYIGKYNLYCKEIKDLYKRCVGLGICYDLQPKID